MRDWLLAIFKPGKRPVKSDLKIASSQSIPIVKDFKPFTSIHPPKYPYLVQAHGHLIADSRSFHYVRVRPDIDSSSALQGVLSQSRRVVQGLVKAERREINRTLWIELFLKEPATHVIHLGYTNEARTYNCDLLYVKVRLPNYEFSSADDTAIDLGEFLIRFVIGQSEDPGFVSMLVLDPDSVRAQVFWLTMLFIRYRALALGEGSVGR